MSQLRPEDIPDLIEILKQQNKHINNAATVEEKIEQLTHCILNANEILGQIEVIFTAKCDVCEKCLLEEEIFIMKQYRELVIQEKRKWLKILRQCRTHVAKRLNIQAAD